MSTAEDDLRDFSAFVRDRISKGEADDLGLAELFDLWMLQNPTDSRIYNQCCRHQRFDPRFHERRAWDTRG